jgi:hypothetical protein
VLHAAAEHGHLAVTNYLLHVAPWLGLSGGAMAATGDYVDRTALHHACLHGHTEVAKALLRMGADADHMPRSGGERQTPRDLARALGRAAILSAMEVCTRFSHASVILAPSCRDRGEMLSMRVSPEQTAPAHSLTDSVVVPPPTGRGQA